MASVSDVPATHAEFGPALEAVDSGDVDGLRELLRAHPDLVRATVTATEPPYDGYFHGATLLHHVAGNPIRGALPTEIVEVARVLLEAGADTEAGCGGGPSQPGPANGTVLGLVTSGAQAHQQGLTEPLLDLLLEHGARLDPDGGMWGTVYHVVEHRGQREVATLLHDRGVNVDLPYAAALGRLDLVRSYFDGDEPRDGADHLWRRSVRGGEEATPTEILADTLQAAATSGRREVVEWLLDRGAPLDQWRAWGPFPVTPLHGAAWAGWPEVVTLLLERGADPTLRDPTYDTTPLGWAAHSERREAIEAFLRAGVRT